MRKQFFIGISIMVAALCSFTPTPSYSQDNVSVVETPLVGNVANYTAFRAPLQQAPLIKLPIGNIKPKGWLLEFLERQRTGLCGELGTVSA